MLKKRTILFGAGSGVINFIANQSLDRIFLIIVDNSESKIGTKLSDLEIVSVKDIFKYEFDEIVITSMYIESIKNQLLSIGISENKIVIPSKDLLKGQKPFESNETYHLATDLLKYFVHRAEKDKKEFIVDFGTLLGIVRENNIIKWDADIDIVVTKAFDNNYENWITSVLANFSTDAKIEVVRKKDSKSFVVSYDINILATTKYKAFHMDISYRQSINDESVHLSTLGLWKSPAEYFDKICRIVWKGMSLQIPSNHIKYLEYLYGNWEIPKVEQTSNDYNHIFNISDVLLENSNYGNFYQEIIFCKNKND